jgi:hypothetical protein
VSTATAKIAAPESTVGNSEASVAALESTPESVEPAPVKGWAKLRRLSEPTAPAEPDLNNESDFTKQASTNSDASTQRFTVRSQASQASSVSKESSGRPSIASGKLPGKWKLALDKVSAQKRTSSASDGDKQDQPNQSQQSKFGRRRSDSNMLASGRAHTLLQRMKEVNLVKPETEEEDLSDEENPKVCAPSAPKYGKRRANQSALASGSAGVLPVVGPVGKAPKNQMDFQAKPSLGRRQSAGNLISQGMQPERVPSKSKFRRSSAGDEAIGARQKLKNAIRAGQGDIF